MNYYDVNEHVYPPTHPIPPLFYRRKTPPPAPAVPLGTKLWRQFDGVAYEGTVDRFDAKYGYYRISYEDGDAEEWTKTELKGLIAVSKHLRAPGAAKRKQPELGEPSESGEPSASKRARRAEEEEEDEKEGEASLGRHCNANSYPHPRPRPHPHPRPHPRPQPPPAHLPHPLQLLSAARTVPTMALTPTRSHRPLPALA